MEALGTLASTPASEESPAAAQQDAENTPARSPTLAPSAATRVPTVPAADDDKTALLDRATIIACEQESIFGRFHVVPIPSRQHHD